MKSLSSTPSKVCKVCGQIYFKKITRSMASWSKSKSCSPTCKYKSLKGKPTWNTGMKIDRNQFPTMGHLKPHTEESLKKITEANIRNAKKHPKSFFQDLQKLAIKVGKERGSYKGPIGQIGEKSATWLGDNANYNSKHKWIQNHWKKTGTCQHCGDIPIPHGRLNHATQWANLDGKYDRKDRESWMELCSKCHQDYDKK